MAFCAKCGRPADGDFCGNCGAPVAVTPQAGASPQPGTAWSPPPPPPIARRRTSPLVWVLVAFLGVVVVFILAAAGGAMFFVHKVRQAGVEPGDFRDNPAVAVAKVLRALDANLDVISVDEARGIVRVRDRNNGKEVTLNFEGLKHGRVEVTTSGDDHDAHLEITDGAAKLPGWVPLYPGAKPQGAVAADSDEGAGGRAHFSSTDTPAKVIAFYQERLTQSGYRIVSTVVTSDSSTLVAEEDGGGRKIVVTARPGTDGTSVNVVYKEKR